VTEEQIAIDQLWQIEAELDTRWPESKIDPSIERIAQLVELLGSPQHSFPIVQVAGTNGKTSVTRMIDSLLTHLDLRTGRFTSPHLQIVTERISLDNKPISPQRYVDTYRDIEPYVTMVDDQNALAGKEIRLSKFEVLTAMAYAAFADAPVEAGVVEVGLGGRWDSTNVADAKVSVICPIDLDHTSMLGETIAEIAYEKAGIIKQDAIVVVAEQDPSAMDVIMREVQQADAIVARYGSEFGVLRRDVAVGGQLVTLQGLSGEYTEIFLPLHGEHQAKNAALALAAVEAFLGAGRGKALDVDAIRQGFAAVTTPGRLEPVRAAPTILLDAAHNPHGAAALAKAIGEEFAFSRLVGVVGVLGDKDVVNVLRKFEPIMEEIVVTQNSSPRALDIDVLAEHAREVFGDERVHEQPHLDDAIELAIELAEAIGEKTGTMSGAGVLITGSVVTAGEARALFGKEPA
jgi:dihydrofolate synthase/folylpolyglutamate synthase